MIIPEEPPKPMGRPPLEPSERRRHVLRPTFNDGELQEIQDRAEASGEAPSAFVRRVALKAIRKNVRKPQIEVEKSPDDVYGADPNQEKADRCERMRALAREQE